MRIFPRIIAITATVIAIGILLSGCSQNTSSNIQIDNNEEGKLAITVVDKVTKKPVNDAKIVIIGMENSYKTDEKGKTPEITLEINKDTFKKYGSELLKKTPSGFATILITKEGYKDYLVFNKAIYPGYSANSMNIQMVSLAKNDKEMYVVDSLYPHDMWIQDLILYCSSIKEEKIGTGENSLTVNIKDQNSKAVEGAAVVIPELGINVKTDKSGVAILKPTAVIDIMSIYPVKRQASEYTIVVSKESYTTAIVFNVTVNDGKAENIVLKPSKNKNDYTISTKPYEKDWIEKIISNCKE